MQILGSKKQLDLRRIPSHFGDLLGQVRQAEGLSCDDFARRLGVSRTNLWYIERRRRAITPFQAAEWARALGYNEAQFVQLALQSLVAEAGLKMNVQLVEPEVARTAVTLMPR